MREHGEASAQKRSKETVREAQTVASGLRSALEALDQAFKASLLPQLQHEGSTSVGHRDDRSRSPHGEEVHHSGDESDK